MIARIQQSMREKDKGFTLIELLVVIIIIGILAAIAIPVFLNQRQKAVDSGIKSDLRSAATEVESSYVDGQTYPADQAAFDALPVQTSPNVDITYQIKGDGFCLVGTNTAGDATQDWVYDSTAGGIQDSSTTSC